MRGLQEVGVIVLLVRLFAGSVKYVLTSFPALSCLLRCFQVYGDIQGKALGTEVGNAHIAGP
jgi:hypothetical protein